MSGALKNDKNPYKMHIIWWILFNGGQYIFILLYVCMSVYRNNPYILNIKIIILQPILCF